MVIGTMIKMAAACDAKTARIVTKADGSSPATVTPATTAAAPAPQAAASTSRPRSGRREKPGGAEAPR